MSNIDNLKNTTAEKIADAFFVKISKDADVSGKDIKDFEAFLKESLGKDGRTFATLDTENTKAHLENSYKVFTEGKEPEAGFFDDILKADDSWQTPYDQAIGEGKSAEEAAGIALEKASGNNDNKDANQSEAKGADGSNSASEGEKGKVEQVSDNSTEGVVGSVLKDLLGNEELLAKVTDSKGNISLELLKEVAAGVDVKSTPEEQFIANKLLFEKTGDLFKEVVGDDGVISKEDATKFAEKPGAFGAGKVQLEVAGSLEKLVNNEELLKKVTDTSGNVSLTQLKNIAEGKKPASDEEKTVVKELLEGDKGASFKAMLNSDDKISTDDLKKFIDNPKSIEITTDKAAGVEGSAAEKKTAEQLKNLSDLANKDPEVAKLIGDGSGGIDVTKLEKIAKTESISNAPLTSIDNKEDRQTLHTAARILTAANEHDADAKSVFDASAGDGLMGKEEVAGFVAKPSTLDDSKVEGDLASKENGRVENASEAQKKVVEQFKTFLDLVKKDEDVLGLVGDGSGGIDVAKLKEVATKKLDDNIFAKIEDNDVKTGLNTFARILTGANKSDADAKAAFDASAGDGLLSKAEIQNYIDKPYDIREKG